MVTITLYTRQQKRHCCIEQSFGLCGTPWTVARQAPLSMGILQARTLEWVPCPSPGDLPNPGIEPSSLRSPALAGRFFTTYVTWEALFYHQCLEIPNFFSIGVLHPSPYP